MNVNFNLPEELMLNVLLKLPVKSLVRFRSVCKTWFFLISSSDFIDSHLRHNQVAENYNVLVRKYTSNYDHDYYSLHSDNEEFNQIKTLDFPVDYVTFVGSANGLICLWDKKPSKAYHMVILWNPALSKFIPLPELSLNQCNRGFVKSSSCFGFGYDSSSNDLKVVMLVTYSTVIDAGFPGQMINDDFPGQMIDDDFPGQILPAVFSFSQKSWKTLDHSASMELHSLELYSEPCNVGGFLYHLVSMPFLEHKIVSFDLRDEVFSDIACPVDVESGTLLNFGLTQFRGSLAQFNHWGCDSGNRYNIWVMRDDGAAKLWTKMFSVKYIGGSVPKYYAVGFSKKGLLVVIGEGVFFPLSDLKDTRLVHYMPPGIEIVREVGENITRWHVDSYQESLLLLKVGSRLHMSPPPSFTMCVGSSDYKGEFW